MFISKEKYAAANERISDLETIINEKDQQIQVLEKQLEEQSENPAADQRAQEELQSQVENLSASVNELSAQKEKLESQIEAKDHLIAKLEQTVDDLNTTVDKLNNEAAEQSATAISQSDSHDNDDSLLHFIAHNADNTQVCVDRLKKAGF